MAQVEDDMTATPEDALAAIPGVAGYLVRRLAKNSDAPSTPGILHLRLLLAGLTYLVARDISPVLVAWL